ncbi:coiled-coil structural protein [Sulfolobus islandicus rod-shaped virus 3]|uniref:Coiled-coil structural protein n=5 Tax=root TaxID=1 RepID=A0A1B3SN30_9VIRU|nr:coiled-coil structural protein [Sulfolobus islandicus rudivirus 3]AOG61587.1 coiled-coil structural protein [Sulfolobus islandicus rod-shaped virus 3]
MFIILKRNNLINMSFLLNLGELGTFFADEIENLENFTNWISSDFINFINAIVNDIKNITSFLGQAISDIPTFMTNIATNFLTILQNFVQTAISTIQGFVSWFEQQVVGAFEFLSSIASDFINSAYSFFQNVANAFAQIISGVISDFLNFFGANMKHISNAISQLTQFLSPFIAPITIGKFLPVIVDKLAEILPEIEIDLAPVGLGGKIPIKFGEIIKAFAETSVDFLNEIRTELAITLKEFIKEPFISDFKITAREIFNEIGLGDLPFADPPFVQIGRWVAVRSFEEIKDHLKETILLTGYPAWFTNAYLEPPVNDFAPKNPLFRPVGIRDLILGTQYGILNISDLEKYAYNNLLTPKTAKLMYQNQTARLLQRTVEQGIRQFIITPQKAYEEIIQNVNLTGKELFLKTFTLEYEYAVQRIVRQFLRSLLSRALSNFGRPYLDFKYLDDTIAKLFKDLGYPEEVRTVFDTMITQSQLIYTNQLLLRQLQQIVRLGIFDQKKIKEELKANKFNEQIALQILESELQFAQLQNILKEYQFKLKSFLISPRDLEKDLKHIGFDSAIISALIYENQTEQLIKFQLSNLESLAKKGYLSLDEIKKQFKAIGIIKEYEDAFINFINQELQISAFLTILKSQLRQFQIDSKIAEVELKKLNINEYLLNQIIQEEYNINIAKLQLSVIETIAKTLYYDQQQLSGELGKIVKDKTALDLYNQKFYYEYIYPKIINYHLQLARHGILSDISKLPKEVIEYEIKPALLTYQTTLEIEYIKESLKDLEIKPDNAINELEKLGMQKDIAQLIVNTYIPTFYNVHTIIQNVIEGQLYKVGKVPINLGNAESELRKLGIPDNQIKILLEQYASTFGLEIWRRHLPSISIIENAIKYNYLDQKLIEYSFIPSELLNLYVNYYQHLLVAQEVQSFKSEYITALIYNYQNLQFESLLKQYGINEALLNVIKLFAQVRKIVTGLQELYLTPTKALSISEYVSNPQQLLQKVFTEFQIPQELQNTYFEYARNRRVSRYVNEIITTISLLFEKHKIDLNTAQSYLQQLKKYGLTDEEIQLITLNWQLRSAY